MKIKSKKYKIPKTNIVCSINILTLYIFTICSFFLLYIEVIESCKYNILTFLLTYVLLTCVVLLCPLYSFFLLYIEVIDSCKYNILTFLLTYVLLTCVVLLCPLYVPKTKNINIKLIFINVLCKLQFISINNTIIMLYYPLIINSLLHNFQSNCISFAQNQFLYMFKFTHVVHLFQLSLSSCSCFYCSCDSGLSEPLTRTLIDLYAFWYWFYQICVCRFIMSKHHISFLIVFISYYKHITCMTVTFIYLKIVKLNPQMNCDYSHFNVYLIPVNKSHCSVQNIESKLICMLFVLQVLLSHCLSLAPRVFTIESKSMSMIFLYRYWIVYV
jgi:hypothetical protein